MCIILDSGETLRCLATRAQREMFLIEQTRPDANCNVWSYKLIRGALDLEVLANAINHLSSKVPIMQTRFIYSDGNLWQIHDESIHHNLTTIDLTTHSTPLKEALKKMKKAAQKSCRMTDDQLYEFTFYVVDSDKYILYARFHHGLIDVRSWSKFETMLAATYNSLKQGEEITVQPKLHFDALACADAMYRASDEYEEDMRFWQAYVQRLKRFAYTQRSINFLGKKTTYRQTMTLGIRECQKLQQAAKTMNIPESFIYIGVSALLLRSLLGREYMSLNLPVRGTYLNKELGMTANVLPLLLHIPEHATIPEVIIQIAQETKSILKHQRYRIEEILQLANYNFNCSFGPVVNILRYDHGDTFEGCSCSSHYGGNIDINDLNITFWTDDSNGRLDILFEDVYGGHSEEQLAALQNHLSFILDQIVCVPNSTVATLDEQCRVVTTVKLRESFYANRRRPITAGFLQWARECEFLVRLVHSNTWVGNGPSPFAASKVLLCDRVVSISKLEHVDSVSRNPPGTVLAIDETAWHVAAADGVVKISNFLNEFGQPISVKTLTDQCHITNGSQLPIITPEQAVRFGDAHSRAMSSEPYWSKRLANFEPCQLSFANNNANKSPVWAATAYLSSRDFSTIEVLTAWLIYIARDTQTSQIQIGWGTTECCQQDKEASSSPYIFAKTVPFGTTIDLNDIFSSVMATVEKDYNQLVNHLPCLSETLTRDAKNFTNGSWGNQPWALAASLIDTQSEYEYAMTDVCEFVSHGSLMTLLINGRKGAFQWIYDANQISEQEINCISSRLLVLLASAHSDDKVKLPVAKLDLLPKAERDLLLFTWNQISETYPSTHCIHQLFEAQVERDGGAVAVECNGVNLSYTELNEQANRLAQYLFSKGVKPDALIALCVERSTTMLVAMLGILKAGGAYVPIDPAYPSQRLANILQDASPLFLLTDAAGRNALGDHKIPMIDLDKPLSTNLSTDNPDATTVRLNSNNLAYVIYTSGSTGTPKGVMVEHKQVVRLFEVTLEKFDFNKKDKWCSFHSFSFDFSVWEIWGALLNGSQLSIVPYNITRSTDEFYDWICTSRITVLNQTPSSLKMLMRSKNMSSRPDRLRFVIFGGEALDPSIMKDWFDIPLNTKSQTLLVNMYGITEITVHATYQPLNAIEDVYSIGRPLPDLCAYVLDSYGEPVPLGAEGELYIGGAGVTRGYLNRPELTAERFRTNPFSDNPAARMYRTGDRARYLPDGNLVYLGRIDQQVKIRGFRIELGEIEAHLVKYPQVQEAVVQSYGNGSDARLVAYIVTDVNTSIAQDLRTHLSALLPDYMVPSAYVCIPSLPLTRNGKLDRRALPAPDDGAFARQLYDAPQGEMEEKLADIWSALLGIERISRHDNFFALGGHSLLVVQLLAQLRMVGLQTAVREVFDASNLATLAATLTPYQSVNIPLNLITTNSTEITPEMLSLINLTQAEIDIIIAQVPGGVGNIQDIYGLAPLQHGMLFHHLMAEEGDPYLVVGRIQFTDRAALERYSTALQEVTKRHDILRTIFIWEGIREPAQIVLRHVPSLLNEITLEGTSETVLIQLTRLFDPRHNRFDLTHAPLLRLMASPTSDGNWIALQLMHHLIIDHSSLDRLQVEIHAIIEGKSEELTMPTPFRNLVAQARLGISPAKYTRFFTEMLGNIDEPTLPFGLRDVGRNGTEINETNLTLPKKLNDQLRMHARLLRVSLSSLCHLAWAQVLSRASGHKAIVFGTVLFGRLHDEETKYSSMGPMINTLPLRLDIDETSVETAVRHTHTRLSALLEHEHAPLVLAQRCSGVPTGLPLFSALLNYRHNQKREKNDTLLPGVTVIDAEERTNYSLVLSVEDDGDSLGLTAQIITPMSAARIGAYMQQALESIVCALTQTPHQPVRTLNVIPPEERTLLLHKWNQAKVTYPPDRCLHQLFEMQVEQNAQAIAVECKGAIFSYRELNTQSNQLAHYLITRGIKPDDRIALCVDRGATMLVAILGILKAGGAYVPIDPAYPSQRLTNILQDSDPKILLTDAIGRRALGDHQVPVVDLDEPLPANLPVDNPDITKLGVSPSHLAYIIYTSGSTGTPKGVMIEHQQVVRLFEATRDKFDFNKEDKWCLFHSISFDLSVWEIWGALLNGSQLSIVPHEITRSTDEFYDWICSRGITVLNQTPSVFKMLMRAKNISSRSNRLRYVIFGGEALDPSIVEDWNAKYDKIQTLLVNMYGITEITVHATYQPLNAIENVYSVGRMLPHLYAYLLDSYGDPVPLGAEGEIYIGGAAVARGYLNRPELTEERFLTDPFSDNPAARMYRSGDRARYLPDGNLVYLGRMDQQVKIRGFRIEPGEIEAHLVKYPQVQEAVVQSYGNGSDARLVAYIVTDVNTSIAQDLRTYLSALLPDYMVPSAYVCLPSLPLTLNGKLDQRALPPPDYEAFARQQYEAPQGEMEETLADIWRDLLGIERISRHDNFFALGGHSLLIVQLLARLRQIRLDTTVRVVFDASNLATLAATLTPYQSVNIPPNLISTDSTVITPEMLPLISLSQSEIDAIVAQIPGGVTNIQDIYGLAPLQHGVLFHHVMAKEGDPYLTVIRLSFIDRMTLKRYASALQQVIERHDILRTAIIWEGLNEPAQVVLRQVPSLLTELTFNDTVETALDKLSHQFNPRHYRLDLSQAPLLRLMAAPTSEGSWVALQLIHHLIDDHTTLKHLQAEIGAIINQQKLTTPTPFRQVVAQARFGVSPDQQTSFFTEMLSDIDEPTLPFGLRDVGRDGTDINEAQLMLPKKLNDQLRLYARHLRVSLSSLCHLAWAQVLARASGRQSVVFGSVLLGRLQAGEGNNNIMGPTINTLPIRIDIDEKSVENAIHYTHARLSALLAHEHAPLVLAQRCSGCPVGLPLFSAMLNYRHRQKTGHVTASLAGISVVDVEERTNYPIILSVEDDGDSLELTPQIITPMSADRIGTYMKHALESMAEALMQTPHKPVRKLNVIPLEERTLMLHTWNETTVYHPPARCLHEIFEEQVEQHGQTIAVECKRESLSYAELNAKANELAHYLIARGVKPDDRIALCVERSTTTVVAILGILKAGGVYVPLDSAYTSQRLTNILRDANPICVLADTTGRIALGDHQVPIVDLNESFPTDFPIVNPDVTKTGISPFNLAYVIYTSGSTGTPKGVMVEHHDAAHLVMSLHKQFEINTQDKWCLFHSISFDVSVWEIWGALLNGCQLSIPSHSTIRSAEEFYEWICASGITVLNQTPSSFKMFMRTKNISSRSDRLRYVILAGEALNSMILRDWYEKYDIGQTVLANLYGPTETVVFATSWVCNFTIPESSPIPIGRPLPNKRIYLLDTYGEPVPLGAEGEVYIGGAGVARGYLNRPELTAESFLPDPFSDTSWARMYRTGDRARYLPDGSLVYLGRIDQQVKIRGFRIEPGEIEAHVVKHPKVQEAVVQSYNNGSDARLVAYVMADTDTLIAYDLRTFLSISLPDYMVPAAYVFLASLPLTSSGKLDRRALPPPDDEAFARHLYEAPQGEMEEKLADIWREVLCIESISRHDNFFALGGHSLLVVRLLAKLRKVGLDTTAREVFDASSLAMLASTLTCYQVVTIPLNLITVDSTEITPEMLPLITLSQTEIDTIIAKVPGGVGNIQDIYGLAPLQSGMLFHHLMAEDGDPYLTVSRMSFNDRTTMERYANALQRVMERHDILRTVFVWECLNEPAQVVLHHVPSLFNEIKINDADNAVFEQLIQKFNPRHYRLNLTHAPLLRLMAAPLSNGSWVVLQLMHHLIIDHSTLEKMQAEVHAIMYGESEKLETPTSFRYLVAHARLRVSPRQHTRFFTEMLSDIDDPIVPFGLNPSGWDCAETNEAHLNLPQTINDQLRDHARHLRVNLSSLCHLAWARVLSGASGREAVVFGTVLLGRLQAGEENDKAMGPMINTLPLRLDIDGTSIEIAVHHTHNRLSALLAHEHAPLVLAQRCSGVPTGLPLFSALLNYRHNQQTSQFETSFPGINYLGSEGQTKYPLTMSLDDDDNDHALSLSVQVVSPISAARICAYMKQALVSMADALTHTPQKPLRTLVVMPQEERMLLLHQWNQNTDNYSNSHCLHQLFEDQVERDSLSNAVECQTG
ncbi:uncharacterized protein LOC129568577 [Sitodiplosis mosellana]|uniref:uncharacterized protein LOC129568577 n=1 Tax=Sitodiplosis mosellana TaxID=263140 RepID=UPI0024451D10|nr:uncharacterized protein LOC129568577 [Sitodiplosis mosellana]